MHPIITQIQNIYCGKEEEIRDSKRKPYRSSYRKKAVNSDQSLTINSLGFIEDTQSDKENHGGTDKAICVYSQKYYDFFQEVHQIALPHCAFGENLTVLDLDDSDFCIGDRFQCGELIVEVSQPRQPCWKISSITGIKNLTSLIVQEYKTGFYFRVIQEGFLSSQDTLRLIARDYPKLTIEFVNRCAFNAKENQEDIKEILACPKLSDAYRDSLSKRYKS